MAFIRDFFSSASFMTHGHCYLWRADILWSNVLSDAVIALAYFSIPVALLYFIRNREDLRFHRVIWNFAAFILLCGATHLVEIWTIWIPDYGFQGFLKAITAVVSIFTAVTLWRLIPKALALPSMQQLEDSNAKLKELTDNLERRVEKRTQEIAIAYDLARANEERYRVLLESSSQMVWTAKPDGEVTYVNGLWIDYTGHSIISSIENFGWGILHRDDKDSVEELWARAMISVRNFEKEVRLKRGSDQSYRWHIVRAMPTLTENGNLKQWIITAIDVQQMKDAETKVLESEARWKGLVDSLPQMCWVADEKCQVSWYNERWFDYTGTSFEAMRGLGWKSVIHPDHLDRMNALATEAFQKGVNWEDTFPIRGKDGRYRWFLSRAMPTYAANGLIENWIGTNTDVTDYSRPSFAG